jgi:hypothetical protein
MDTSFLGYLDGGAVNVKHAQCDFCGRWFTGPVDKPDLLRQTDVCQDCADEIRRRAYGETALQTV